MAIACATLHKHKPGKFAHRLNFNFNEIGIATTKQNIIANFTPTLQFVDSQAGVSYQLYSKEFIAYIIQVRLV